MVPGDTAFHKAFGCLHLREAVFHSSDVVLQRFHVLHRDWTLADWPLIFKQMLRRKLAYPGSPENLPRSCGVGRTESPSNPVSRWRMYVA